MALAVKLLFDENLAQRLVHDLADLFPASSHIVTLGLIGAADHRVWEVARLDGYVLVTKDEDFHRLSVLRGAPPKVIWIRLGNCATADVARLLRFRAEHIHEFAADVESAILALG
ncbi:MAG: DUF5615 family PIN-like protein [Gemmatimonadota bacterium]